MQPVIVHNSRRSILTFVFSCGLIVVFGLWIKGLAELQLIHVLLFLLFVIPAGVWQWLDRRPQIVLDDAGIGGPRVPGHGLAWAQLKRAYIKPVGKVEHLCLEVNTYQGTPGKSMRVIPVRLNHLELSSAQLLNLVQERLSRSLLGGGG